MGISRAHFWQTTGGKDEGMKLHLIVAVAVSILSVQIAVAQDAPEAGDTRIDEHGIEQVWVPAGCFQMGTSEAEAEAALELEAPSWATRRLPSEQPQHEVCLSAGYWIDKYEVTNAVYQAFVDDGGYTNEAYWSENGWRWLQGRNADELPVSCDQGIEGGIADHPRVCVTWFEAEAYAN